MPLDLQNFEDAIRSLTAALASQADTPYPEDTPEWELMRDGVIQRFEYTFELAWKTLKRYLEEYALEKADSFSNRDLFRRGYELGLLHDAEVWFDYLKKRNLTSHTYNSATAGAVYQAARTFAPDVCFLLAQLQERTR
jgi:nucleotidyltransferase substrate binding protein (TIGR01987 family)